MGISTLYYNRDWRWPLWFIQMLNKILQPVDFRNLRNLITPIISIIVSTCFLLMPLKRAIFSFIAFYGTTRVENSWIFYYCLILFASIVVLPIIMARTGAAELNDIWTYRYLFWKSWLIVIFTSDQRLLLYYGQTDV